MKYELSSATFEFTQEQDSVSSGDSLQELRVKVDDAGGGHFFVIETSRWAFDDPDDLAVLVADVRKRLSGWWL